MSKRVTEFIQITFAGLGVLGGLSLGAYLAHRNTPSCYQGQPVYLYNQRVEITHGFYKGSSATIKDYYRDTEEVGIKYKVNLGDETIRIRESYLKPLESPDADEDS